MKTPLVAVLYNFDSTRDVRSLSMPHVPRTGEYLSDEGRLWCIDAVTWAMDERAVFVRAHEVTPGGVQGTPGLDDTPS